MPPLHRIHHRATAATAAMAILPRRSIDSPPGAPEAQPAAAHPSPHIPAAAFFITALPPPPEPSHEILNSYCFPSSFSDAFVNGESETDEALGTSGISATSAASAASRTSTSSAGSFARIDGRRKTLLEKVEARREAMRFSFGSSFQSTSFHAREGRTRRKRGNRSLGCFEG